MAVEFVYRAMVEDEGRPLLGSSATKLGVREGTDIEVQEAGKVLRPDFDQGGKNGVSCSPSIADLPEFAIPKQWGGRNRRTCVWRIALADLGPDLVAQQDGPGHVSIGPARGMSFEDYVDAIHRTAPDWELVLPEEHERQ